MTKSNVTRRSVIGRLAAGVSLAAAQSEGLVGTARAQSSSKTFVLIPGVTNGGWVWRRVSGLLEEKGHKVYALTLTGLGERSHLLSKDINLDTHVTDIVNVIKWEGLTNFCLVAFSYSGFPASGALEHVGDGASSIIWVDAFKPKNGDTVIDTLSGPGRDRIQKSVDKGEIGLPLLASLPLTLVNAKDAPFLLAKNTPHPVATLVQPIKLSGALERVPKKTYIRLPKNSPAPAFDKALAECKADKSWNTFELTDSGHMAMLDAPDRLTDLLLQAA